MECAQKALKNSSAETVLKPTAAPQTFSDDFWTVGGNGQVSDDFFVDNLLDFSEAPVLLEDEEQQNQEYLQLDKSTVVSQVEPDVKVKDSTDSIVAGSDLCFPADDVADLEWLSHFVDDTSTGYSLTVPAGMLPVKPELNYSDPVAAAASVNTIFTTVQTKARSKRTRTGVRVWSLGSNSLTDPSSSSSSSSLTTSFSNPWAFYNDLGQSAESVFGKPPAKKKQATDSGAQPRRCSHCLVQKTPQWRTGPLGAKTLCNACGVRFKSGRLLPEYRPACSPTFSSEIHSNNHRKVMEMRRKKEGEDGGFAVAV